MAIETRGRKALGPLIDPSTPPLTESDVEVLQTHLTVSGGDFNVTPPAEFLGGLLSPFNTRARAVLVALLRGYSRGMAAAAGGVGETTVEGWEKRHPEFREAMVQCLNLGFRRVFEPELYRRALAGPEDRGSMRALELVTKARDSAYRDKSQVQHELIQRAVEAEVGFTSGWQQGAIEDAGGAAS